MKVTIAICDDDINCADLIENYISEFKNVVADCDVCSSGEELIQAYSANTERYEVVFLDMEMEQLTGIETAKHIRELDEHVIIVFITSHTEYMYESFKCTPFRFLIKPLDNITLLQEGGLFMLKQISFTRAESNTPILCKIGFNR